jgi:pimeloyl-ACP methyl ester carboxylesterase
MIRRIAFALLATASIPMILHAPAVHAATAPAPADLIQMDHISVQVIGKGSPVILIPGLSSPRAVWDGVAPELARTHTVYLVQVNGFGGDAPGANLGAGLLPGMVADLHKLVTDRKIAGAAVVGHSMGGLLTLMLAQAHPGDVGKALIVDALPFVGSAFFPGSTVESVQPQAAAMRAQMAGLYGQPLPEAVGQAIARQNALKPASQATVAAWMAKADMRVSGQAMYEDLQTDLRPQMKGVATPITVLVPWTAVRGGEAPVVDLYKREYVGAPHVTVKGVGDSGHFIMLDQPEAFRDALTAFLAG